MLKFYLRMLITIFITIIFFSGNLFAEEIFPEDKTYTNDTSVFHTSTSSEWTGGLLGIGAGFGMIFLFAKNKKNPFEGIMVNPGYFIMPFTTAAGVSIAGSLEDGNGSYGYSQLYGCLGAIAGEGILLASLFLMMAEYPISDDDNGAPSYLNGIAYSIVFVVIPALELACSVAGYNTGKKHIGTNSLISIDDSSVAFGIPLINIEFKRINNYETVYYARLVEIKF